MSLCVCVCVCVCMCMCVCVCVCVGVWVWPCSHSRTLQGKYAPISYVCVHVCSDLLCLGLGTKVKGLLLVSRVHTSGASLSRAAMSGVGPCWDKRLPGGPQLQTRYRQHGGVGGV